MKSSTRAFIAVAIAALVGIGLIAWKSKIGHGATVEVTAADIELLLADAPPQALAQLAASEEARKQLADNLRTTLSIAEEARAAGYANKPEIRRQLEIQRAVLLATAYAKKHQEGGAATQSALDKLVSQAEIEEFYKAPTNDVKFKETIEDIKKQGAPELQAEELETARKEYASLFILARKAEEEMKQWDEKEKRKFELQLQQQQARVLIQAYAEDLTKRIEAKPEEIEAYLKENPELDEAGAKTKAEDVLKQIRGGGDFTALAKKYSSDGSRSKGGDLGYFTRGRMVPEFEQTAFNTPVGQVSEPVKSQFGYHIIKVTDKRANNAGGQPTEEVRASHILIPISTGQPENPMMPAPDPRARAKTQIETEKQEKLLEEIKKRSRVVVAENFKVPEPKPGAAMPPGMGMRPPAMEDEPGHEGHNHGANGEELAPAGARPAPSARPATPNSNQRPPRQ